MFDKRIPKKLYLDPSSLQLIERKSKNIHVGVICFLVGLVFSISIMYYFSYVNIINISYDNSAEEISKLEKKVSDLGEELQIIQIHDEDLLRTVLGMEELPKDIRSAGFGGADYYSEYLDLENSEMIIGISKKIDNLESKILVQKKSLDKIASYYANKRKHFKEIPLIEPVVRVGRIRYTSGFGYRVDPFLKIKKFHKGIDFSTPIGTSVIATADGVVSKVKKNRTGYGIQIVLKHNERYSTRYAHLSKTLVKKGEKVVRGQEIAKSGNSGRSTAPHLHYEVMLDNKHTNPLKHVISNLSVEEYNQLVSLAESENISLD